MILNFGVWEGREIILRGCVPEDYRGKLGWLTLGEAI